MFIFSTIFLTRHPADDNISEARQDEMWVGVAVPEVRRIIPGERRQDEDHTSKLMGQQLAAKSKGQRQRGAQTTRFTVTWRCTSDLPLSPATRDLNIQHFGRPIHKQQDQCYDWQGDQRNEDLIMWLKNESQQPRKEQPICVTLLIPRAIQCHTSRRATVCDHDRPSRPCAVEKNICQSWRTRPPKKCTKFCC